MALAGALAAALAGCQSAPASAPGHRGHAASPARWIPFRHDGTVADLTVPRAGGSLTVLTGGRLQLLSTAGALTPFARGRSGFANDPGAESYLALVPGAAVPGTRCSFTADTVYALWPRGVPGVFQVSPAGRARRFATLRGTFPDGIAYDSVGRFGHRLLVTSALKGRPASLFSIDCAGHVTTVSSRLPHLEGGLAVAPPSFGRYGGDLIATDELSGRIWAISPSGQATLLARPALPTGQDIGVESTGFVPPGFSSAWTVYVADRRTPGNPHPGTGNILRLPGADLLRAGARPGDLVVVSEGGAPTVLVRCSAACTVRRIADGPPPAHIEGHVIFVRTG